MSRTFFALGAGLALVGVAAGAFASHGLEGRLPADALDTFETAVRYQLYHALGLLAVGLASRVWPGGPWAPSGWLFLAGVLLFCGSLYALALGAPRWLGAVAPFGGAAFLAGWGLSLLAVLRAGG